MSGFFIAGEVIKHGDMKCIPGEGMPTRGNPYERGNLVVQFIIRVPPQNFVSGERVRF
jgi:DnaJ-class molecular chaperone